VIYSVGDIVRIKTLEEIKRQYSYYLLICLDTLHRRQRPNRLHKRSGRKPCRFHGSGTVKSISQNMGNSPFFKMLLGIVKKP
jgi:hypothetical protein